MIKKIGKWFLLLPAILSLFISCQANNSTLNSGGNSNIEQSFESDSRDSESASSGSDVQSGDSSESDKQSGNSSGSDVASDKNSTGNDSEDSGSDGWIDINFPRP